MKRGILIALLSALAGGLTAYAVVNLMTKPQVQTVQSVDGAQFRTVSLSHDNWPDFTYAAESAVDAVVYVKVVSTQTQQQAPSSIFDFFFGFPEGGAPQQRERVGSGSGVIIREDGYIVTRHIPQPLSEPTLQPMSLFLRSRLQVFRSFLSEIRTSSVSENG